jgi:hypothetical protein
MSSTKLTAIVLASAVLAGCAANVPLSREQIGRISGETSATELDSILGKATVSSEYDFDANGGHYHARHLQLQTGTTSQMTMVCTKTCIPINTVIPVTTDYVVVQQLPTRKLLGWGTLEELSKSADDHVAAIMPKLKQVATERKEAAKK